MIHQLFANDSGHLRLRSQEFVVSKLFFIRWINFSLQKHGRSFENRVPLRLYYFPISTVYTSSGRSLDNQSLVIRTKNLFPRITNVFGVADTTIFLLFFSPERFCTRTDMREERKKKKKIQQRRTHEPRKREKKNGSEWERRGDREKERREGWNAKTQRMNKIGDVEYFALGSSGHFTRHFNPWRRHRERTRSLLPKRPGTFSIFSTP